MSKEALYKKIIAVMKEVGQMQKDGDINDKNGKKMYSYLSEEQTTGELQKAFITHGLVLFPIKVDSEIVVLESFAYDKESKTPITKVIVTYKICDTDTGESEELMSIGYGSDSQDKGSNKAMTGAFKYVQRQTFMISTGDDGDHTGSHELDKRQQPETNTPPRQQYQSSSNTPPPPTTPTSQPSVSGNCISEGQVKMVWAKMKNSQYANLPPKDVCELISAHLTKTVTDFAHIEKSDINKVIAWFEKAA